VPDAREPLRADEPCSHLIAKAFEPDVVVIAPCLRHNPRRIAALGGQSLDRAIHGSANAHISSNSNAAALAKSLFRPTGSTLFPCGEFSE
jgi:hypothetical protein